jgi:proteasome lid subunit RPN8/RPN11
MIEVQAAVDAQVRAAVLKAYPEETCGLLIGPVPKDFNVPGRRVRVEEARALANGWEASARSHRYAIDPLELMKVEKELSGTGRGIVGFYHSHPNVPAWPSPFDLMRAWPCYSYWILGAGESGITGSRSWLRSEDGNSFLEEEITLINGDDHERSSQASHGVKTVRG